MMEGFINFIRHDFGHAAPILAAGGFGVAIILERIRALVFAYPIRNTPQFVEKIRDLVMADRVAEALTYTEQMGSKPAALVVREALLRAHQPEDLIHDGLELAVSEATQKVTARTAFLATIANVATLLGLFGTILGLIQSFQAVGSASAQQRSALLAQGISTAMNATMMGLAVAIPCMVAFSYLMNRSNRLNAEVEQMAMRMMDIIKQRFYDADSAPSRKAQKRSA
jgi:biopolymer transport protein ExbB/TolQ